MAEFVQTMKDMRRMCDAYASNCDKCPLASYECACTPKHRLYFTDEQVEAIVATWAAGHPEQVYPRWVDWLVQVGVVGCETCRGHKHYFVENDMFEHIPEETAQLLGLKPLPVVHGDCEATNEADTRYRLGLGLQPKEG